MCTIQGERVKGSIEVAPCSAADHAGNCRTCHGNIPSTILELAPLPAGVCLFTFVPGLHERIDSRVQRIPTQTHAGMGAWETENKRGLKKESRRDRERAAAAAGRGGAAEKEEPSLRRCTP